MHKICFESNTTPAAFPNEDHTQTHIVMWSNEHFAMPSWLCFFFCSRYALRNSFTSPLFIMRNKNVSTNIIKLLREKQKQKITLKQRKKNHLKFESTTTKKKLWPKNVLHTKHSWREPQLKLTFPKTTATVWYFIWLFLFFSRLSHREISVIYNVRWYVPFLVSIKPVAKCRIRITHLMPLHIPTFVYILYVIVFIWTNKGNYFVRMGA